MKPGLKNKISIPVWNTFRYLIAFFVPIAAFLAAWKLLKIIPYGDNSLLCMDLWGQYFGMYVQSHNIDSLSDFLYQWTGALGYNNFAQSSYYCNSIFFIAFRFVGLSNLIETLDIICLLKFGLSSVTCLAFLDSKIEGRRFFSAAGAIAYSLCAYSLAYVSQPMFTDSIIYLPLILIGLDKIIKGKSPAFYSIMLAVTMISSFYISFSICIFLILYIITEIVVHYKSITKSCCSSKASCHKILNIFRKFCFLNHIS